MNDSVHWAAMGAIMGPAGFSGSMA
jgi:hypothetical protein